MAYPAIKQRVGTLPYMRKKNERKMKKASGRKPLRKPSLLKV